jgi:tRNA dimethylallyltransferase
VRGDLDEADAIAQTQSLTRRYARRQVSWFRRDASIVPMDADATDLVDQVDLRVAADLAGTIGE